MDIQYTPDHYYRSNDLVRISCPSCEGCGECCHGMDDTIVLDPYDFHQFLYGAGLSFADLMNSGKISLHSENGLTLPHIVMQEETGACGFLADDGRCSVHMLRPGICRLFPLARDYSDETVRYFILPDTCPKPGRTKVRISRWIGVPDFNRYEDFKLKWHQFLRDLMESIPADDSPDTAAKRNYLLLEYFFLKPCDNDDFYLLMDRRMKRIRKALGF